MLKNYIKIALKILLRRKYFTAISLIGISFTLIILIVATALLDHVFGKYSPETELDRSLGVYRVHLMSDNGMTSALGSYELFTKMLKLSTLPGIEAASISTVFIPTVVYNKGERFSFFLRRTDAAYWDILDFEFIEGRPYSKSDVDNGNFVAVINETTKRKLYGDEPASGKEFVAEGRIFKVSGVVKDVQILRFTPFSEIWAPLSTSKDPEWQNDGLYGMYIATILAKDKDKLPLIKEEFKNRVANLEHPDLERYDSITVVPESIFQNFARLIFGMGGESAEDKSNMLLMTFIILAVFFMLLPTINLININVSRISERASEIGVRKAFGASTKRLIGQFVVENLILTIIGGILGFIFSAMILQYINYSQLIPYADLFINFRIFAYCFTITMFFGLFSGLYPAWKMSRMHPVDALKESIQ